MVQLQTKRSHTCSFARLQPTFPALSAIDTCGVERAGKAYKPEVLSSLRKAMEEKRAMKAVYIYSNYNLNEHKQSAVSWRFV